MNIKEVEKITGISSQNIRFYEKEGLVKPLRDDNNGYRVYSEDDIKLLKLIKILRMLDMPVGEIKELLSGANLSLCLDKQKELLEKKVADAMYAIKMCDGLKDEYQLLNDIDKKNILEEVIYTISLSMDNIYDNLETVSFQVNNEEISTVNIKDIK